MSTGRHRSIPSVRRIYQMDARECRKEMQKATWERMRIKEVWDAFLYRSCVVRADFTAVDLSLVLDVVGKQPGIEKEKFTEFMLDEVRRKVHNFSVRDVALVFNALAKMQVVDVLLLNAFLPYLVKKLPSQAVEPKNAALLAFSLVRSELPTENVLPVLDQVVATLTPRIEKITDGHALSLLVFAFSKIDNAAFLHLCEKQIHRSLPKCRSTDLIYLLRAYKANTSELLVFKTQKELLSKRFEIKAIEFGHLLDTECLSPFLKEKILDEMRYRVRDFRPSTCVRLFMKVDAATQVVFLRYLSKRKQPTPPLVAHEILELALFVAEHYPSSDDAKEALLLQLRWLKTCEDAELVLSIMEIYAKLKIRDTHWHHILAPQRFRKDQLGRVARCLAQLSLATVFDEQHLLSRCARDADFLHAAAVFALTKVPSTLELETLASEEKPPLLSFALNEESLVPIPAPPRSEDLRQRVQEHLAHWDVYVHKDVDVPHAYTVPFALDLSEIAHYIEREPLVDFDLTEVADVPEYSEEEEADEIVTEDHDVVGETVVHEHSPFVSTPNDGGIDRRTHVLVDILSVDDFYHRSDRIVSLSQRSKGLLLNMERLAYLNVLKRLQWPVITVSELSWNHADTPQAYERNRRYIITLISHLVKE